LGGSASPKAKNKLVKIFAQKRFAICPVIVIFFFYLNRQVEKGFPQKIEKGRICCPLSKKQRA